MHTLILSAGRIWRITCIFFYIFFKRKKSVQVSYIRYSRRYLFQQSYLIIECSCKNVLWLSIEGYGTFTNANIVLNISKLQHRQLKLTVQGLFNKRVFYVEVQPEEVLQTQTFRTAITEWHLPAMFRAAIQLQHKSVSLLPQQVVCAPAVEVKLDNITFLPSLFNQADFI